MALANGPKMMSKPLYHHPPTPTTYQHQPPITPPTTHPLPTRHHHHHQNDVEAIVQRGREHLGPGRQRRHRGGRRRRRQGDLPGGTSDCTHQSVTAQSQHSHSIAQSQSQHSHSTVTASDCTYQSASDEHGHHGHSAHHYGVWRVASSRARTREIIINQAQVKTTWLPHVRVPASRSTPSTFPSPWASLKT